jgi:hypothetical protein
MTDFWTDTSFEFASETKYPNDTEYCVGGYVNFELMKDGCLEIVVSDGGRHESRDGRLETRYEEVKFTPERTVELLAGLQVWIEGLDKPTEIE